MAESWGAILFYGLTMAIFVASIVFAGSWGVPARCRLPRWEPKPQPKLAIAWEITVYARKMGDETAIEHRRIPPACQTGARKAA